MNFEEAIAAVESLAGTAVDVTVWGASVDASSMVELSGVLVRMSEPDIPVLPELADAEQAIVFCVGDHGQLILWPSRFLSAERGEIGRDIWIKTLDGDFGIGPPSRAWID